MIPTPRQARAELARRDMIYFSRFLHRNMSFDAFHYNYYKVLDLFARGRIRRLIVTIPPQHGKSQGASVLTPAYILGLDPSLRIAVASYNLSLASKFNRQIQRTIDSRSYAELFPETRLKRVGERSSYVRTAEESEVVEHGGSVIAVGREGALTGNPVDVMIIDDLYKDAMEANSPIVRDNAWDWYTSVVRTRLHNASRELIVFTRWHEDDLVGRISKLERVVDIVSLEQLEAVLPDDYSWYRLNFEAIKESDPTPIDPRPYGAALWETRHSRRLLDEKRALDRVQFACMYQGQPVSKDLLLYGDGFKTYTSVNEDDIVKFANYTDTADAGEDYLCSVCYCVSREGLFYVTDIVYTQQAMEHTEMQVAAMLNRNRTRIAYVESNNGGRGFARNVARLAADTKVEWFFQGANKREFDEL